MTKNRPFRGGFGICLVGAWDRGRTGDPSLFRGMLYQLSYPSRISERVRRFFENPRFSTGYFASLIALLSDTGKLQFSRPLSGRLYHFLVTLEILRELGTKVL
jgi:hypothetical protein